jgi:hypothetical protein
VDMYRPETISIFLEKSIIVDIPAFTHHLFGILLADMT